ADRDNPSGPNPFYAVRYPSGSATPTDLPLVAGFNSAYGFGINDPGHVIGYADNNGVGPTRGYFYNGTSATALGTLAAGDQSFANGINATDTIVGDSNTTAGGPSHAVIYNGTTPVDLNSLQTGGAPWNLQIAWGISDT